MASASSAHLQYRLLLKSTDQGNRFLICAYVAPELAGSQRFLGSRRMATVDLTKAKAVRGASDAKRANELIALGWTLIDTASGKDESGYPLTTYSLAWFGDGEPREY